jgi:hypothetical protein
VEPEDDRDDEPKELAPSDGAAYRYSDELLDISRLNSRLTSMPPDSRVRAIAWLCMAHGFDILSLPTVARTVGPPRRRVRVRPPDEGEDEIFE